MALPEKTDVLIVGAGPVGLLLAYQLSKFGIKDYVIIDQEDKTNAPTYGRACTLWPRTLESLDQLGLVDELFAEGGVCSSNGYNFKDGKVVKGGISFGHKMDQHGDTAFKFCLNLRQRLIERAIESKLKDEYGVQPYYGYKLYNFGDSHGELEEEYPVGAMLKRVDGGGSAFVDAKWIIGCDGGKSSVRKTANIEFKGSKSGAKWVRLDAKIRSNNPGPRLLNSITTSTHGLVLLCPIDNGLTRVGFVWTEALQQKWEGMKLEEGELVSDGIGVRAAMEEAMEAVKPFEMVFDGVEWFTIYGIGQCMAQQFVKGNVILAGDACHTHSSGSAQGLNTGMHDVLNLAWKLSFQLKGLTSRKIIDSYIDERKAIVQQVIDNDIALAGLTGGKKLGRFEGRKEGVEELMEEWFRDSEAKRFTIGLGIAYPENNAINTMGSQQAGPVSAMKPGERAPEVNHTRIGTGEDIRLQSALGYDGRYNVVVFTGEPHLTSTDIVRLRAWVDARQRQGNDKALYDMFTIIASGGVGAAEVLGCQPFGKAYFDATRQAHEIYGIDTARGAVMILRPDGYIAAMTPLKDAGVAIASYFDQVFGKI